MPEVYLLDIDEDLTAQEYHRLTKVLSQEKQERLSRFRFFVDAQRSLFGEIMARALLAERTGLPNERLLFRVNENGKPFLESQQNIHFNISHGGKYVACAIDDEPVGIDVERIQEMDRGVAERFFAPDEISYVTAPPDETQAERYIQIWTMKESRLKWEGIGLAKCLSSFSVLDKREDVYYHKVLQNSESICYVCTLKASWPLCRILGKKDFMKMSETLL